MNRTIVIAAMAIIAAIWAFVQFGGDRDARRIHGRLDGLVAAVEKTDGEGHIRMLARTQSIPGYFTSDATIQLAPLYGGTLTRRDIASYVARIHASMDRFTVRITDRQLEVNRAAGTAVMQFSARGRIELGNESESHSHAFQMEWIKEDGEWYIQRVNTVQSIRRPGTAP